MRRTLLFLPLLAGLSTQAGAGVDGDVDRRVQTVVARATEWSEGERDEASSALQSLEADVAPSLVRIVLRGKLLPVEAEEPERLDARQRDFALLVLDQLPFESVRRALDAESSREDSVASRIAQFEVLARLDDDRAIVEALRVAQRFRTSADWAESPSLQLALADTVRTHLDADPKRIKSVIAAWPVLSDAIRSCTIDEAASVHDSDVAEWLAKVAYSDWVCRGAALHGLAAVPDVLSATVRRQSLRVAELELGDPASAHPAAAATLMGALRSEAHVEDLIVVLEAEDARVRAAAHRALREISGLNLAAQEGPWMRWIATERTWHRDRAETARSALRDGDGADAVRALNEITMRRLDRPRLAEIAANGLTHDDPSVRTLTCLTLERLAEPAAQDALRAALLDPLPSVRRAVRSALAACGGRVREADTAQRGGSR